MTKPDQGRQWHDISSAPLSEQVLVWEPMYGWLLASKSHSDGKWTIKSTGNYWAEMPESVASTITHWQRLPMPPSDRGIAA